MQKSQPSPNPTIHNQLLTQTTKLCQKHSITPSIKLNKFCEWTGMCYELNPADGQKICIDMHSMLSMYYRIYVKEWRSEGKEEKYEEVFKKHVRKVQGIVDWIYEEFKPISYKLVFPQYRPYTKQTNNSQLYYPLQQQHQNSQQNPSNSIPPPSEPLFNRLLQQKIKLSSSNPTEQILSSQQQEIQFEWCYKVFINLDCIEVSQFDRKVLGIGIHVPGSQPQNPSSQDKKQPKPDPFHQAVRKIYVTKYIKTPWIKIAPFNKYPCLAELSHLTSEKSEHSKHCEHSQLSQHCEQCEQFKHNYCCYTWNPYNLVPLPKGMFVVGVSIEDICEICQVQGEIDELEKLIDTGNSKKQGNQNIYSNKRNIWSSCSQNTEQNQEVEVIQVDQSIYEDRQDSLQMKIRAKISNLQAKLPELDQKIYSSSCIIYNYQWLIDNISDNDTINLPLYSRPKQFYLPYLDYFSTNIFKSIQHQGLRKQTQKIIQISLIDYLLYQLHPLSSPHQTNPTQPTLQPQPPSIQKKHQTPKQITAPKPQIKLIYQRQLQESITIDTNTIKIIYSQYCNTCIFVHRDHQEIIDRYIPKFYQFKMFGRKQEKQEDKCQEEVSTEGNSNTVCSNQGRSISSTNIQQVTTNLFNTKKENPEESQVLTNHLQTAPTKKKMLKILHSKYNTTGTKNYKNKYENGRTRQKSSESEDIDST